MHALVLTALTWTLPLDVISTLPLEGDVTADGGDYVRIPFEVPEGTVEIRYQHADNSTSDILDFGMRDPDGQRGWCGGLTDDDVIGVAESTRCYMPGPIEAGSTWYVEIGKAKLVNDSVHYNVVLEFRDAATLEPRPRADFAPVVVGSQARWYAGDFHVHSVESGDATATFDQIRDLARARGIDFVNLSDHNVVTQHPLIAAYQAGVDDVLFLRGSEVTTYAGHGNAVGNASYIDHHIGQDGRTVADLIDQVVGDGALFIVNHPKLDLGDSCIGCAWKYDDDTPWDEVTGIELQTGPYLYEPIFTPLVLAMWDDLLDRGYRITGVSGSDDHRSPTEPANDQSQIGTPTSMVWAEELSEAGIMEGVRAGRVVVKLRGPDDPMLELSAETDRGERGMIGDTVTGARVSLTASASGADGMQMVLMRNGAMDEIVDVTGNEFTHTFERDTRGEGDRYRVHLSTVSDVTITNHIWVEYADPVGGDPGGADAGTGEEPRHDDGGCGCRAGASPGGGPGALLVAAAALFGIRRRRSRR